MSEYLEKYDVASEASGSLFNKGVGLALATATDIVTTLWNSLPLTPEARTDDILSRISDDALQVYNENTDTVRTLSLVGGALVPASLGLKLLGRLRAGVESAGFSNNLIGGTFAGTRQKVMAAEIEKIFADGKGLGSEMKQLSRNLKLSNVAQEVMDNAAIELAVVGAMNAHPYMEDYFQDPVKNFAIGAGLGGVLGAGFGWVKANRTIREVTAPIEAKALATVRGELEESERAFMTVHDVFTNAGRYQMHQANVRMLDGIIDSADQGKYNQLTKDIAASYRLEEAASAQRVLTQEAATFLGIEGPIPQNLMATIAKGLGEQRLEDRKSVV